jgi:transposase
MGRDLLDCLEDRLHGRDFAPLDTSGRAHRRIKDLEREVRELRQANEILRKASAYFAQAELDRRFRP